MQPRSPRSRLGSLAPVVVVAAAALLVGGTALLVRLATSQSGTPVAVASATPAVSPTVATPPPSPSPALTPSPSPVPSPAPTPSPAPAASVRPVPSPTPSPASLTITETDQGRTFAIQRGATVHLTLHASPNASSPGYADPNSTDGSVLQRTQLSRDADQTVHATFVAVGSGSVSIDASSPCSGTGCMATMWYVKVNVSQAG
ncbi:MAG: hypothetical protein ACYDAY_09100 [Candidatus Dormibacteria bacterium]